MTQDKKMLPQVITGYALDITGGMFSVVLNESTVNLFVNPSGEKSVSGFNPTIAPAASSVSRTIDKQTQGSYGIKAVTNAVDGSGVYKSVICTAGQHYTFSVDAWGLASFDYELIIRVAPSSTILTRKAFRSLRKWKRPYLSFQAPVTQTYEFCVVQKTPRVHTFYTDGWQLENKTYPTTYCDGDMEGYVFGEQAYKWTGKPHETTSSRLSTTRSGGREYFLSDLNFRVTGTTGLGMAPVDNFAKEITSGGEFYMGSSYAARVFTVIGSFFGRNIAELNAKKRILENLVDFNKSQYAQEILLRYRPDGDKISTVYDIKCHYMTGLEGNFSSLYQESVTIQFKQSSPFVVKNSRVAYRAASPGAVSPADETGSSCAIIRKATGEIVNLLSDSAKVTNGSIYAATYDRYNGIYVVGGFTTINGVAANRIAYYNGTDFVACGAGTNGTVLTVIELPNEKILIGGSFTQCDGDAAKGWLAEWDPILGTWAAYGSPNQQIDSLLYLNGYVYAAGNYTGISGGGISYISRTPYAAAAFVAMGTSGGACKHVAGYYNAGTKVTTIYIAVQATYKVRSTIDNGTAWTDIYTSSPAATTAFQGMTMYGSVLYFIAAVDTGATYKLHKVWRWNGVAISQIMTGSTLNAYSLWGIYALSNGGILFGHDGAYLDANGNEIDIPFIYSYYFHNQQFYPGDLAGTTTTHPKVFAENKNVPLEWFIAAEPVISLSTTLINEGQSIAYPTYTFTGPGTLYWIKNTTNNQHVFFNDLDIAINEIITVSMSPTKINVRSNFYGDISGAILGSWAAPITLVIGENKVSILYTGTPFPTALTELFIIGATEDNTDNGVLHATGTEAAGVEKMEFFKDAAKTQLVAETLNIADATKRIFPRNSSGLAGWLIETTIANATAYTYYVGLCNVSWVEQYPSINGLK